jgi:hypothetical protein
MCSCYPISLQGCPPNWNPECRQHGLNSEWYNSPAQVEKREADAARLADLVHRARESRRLRAHRDWQYRQ